MLILEELVEIADNKISEIINIGHAKEGNNGPYHFGDTPVRTSAHWCITYSYLYKVKNEKKYLKVLRVLGDYLKQEQEKTCNGTIECMDGEKFDHINGLIGQAWVIEGLVAVTQATGDMKYVECARKIFKAQKFVQEEGIWERVDINGENLGFDLTFNHQLWFAAAGAYLLSCIKDEEIAKELDAYIDQCYKHFDIYNTGLIKHYGTRVPKITVRGLVKRIIKICMPKHIFEKMPANFNELTYENAYHLFNMYGFALLYNNYGTHSFFESAKFTRAINYCLDVDNFNKIFKVSEYEYKSCNDDVLKQISRFAYAYNSPAFEFGYVAKTFMGDDNINKCMRLWSIQKNLCYSNTTKMFDRNTDDAETLTARIYEITRYLELIDEDAKKQ